MKKAHKDMLKGAGVATAILVFSTDTYAWILSKVRPGGSV